MINAYDSLLNVIGNTPLVKINFETTVPVYAKLEYFNPTGSIKDRSVKYMIEKAEKEGKLKPGGTIIEASSGNQGVAAAFIGKLKGYRVIITIPDKTSEEKRRAIAAYGAEIVVCSQHESFESEEGYYQKACTFAKTIENSFMINQYYNTDNIDAHYYGISRELYDQAGDEATHLFLAMGTSGTATGVGRYFKEKNPNIKIIGVDSANSYFFTKGNPKPSVLEGIGVPHQAPLYDKNVIDAIIGVSDEDAIKMLKKLSQNYGYLVGSTTGAVFHAISTFDFKKSDVVLTIVTDSGRAYLSKNFY